MSALQEEVAAEKIRSGRVQETRDLDGNLISQRVIRGNKDFKQFSNRHLSSIRAIAQENPCALAVFLLLIEHMDKKNALVISRETISDLLGISTRSVSSHVKYLKDRQLIAVMRSGSSNIYHLNAQVVWSSTADKKKYAKLDAAVVLSEKEQRDPFAMNTDYEKHVTKKEA